MWKGALRVLAANVITGQAAERRAAGGRRPTPDPVSGPVSKADLLRICCSRSRNNKRSSQCSLLWKYTGDLLNVLGCFNVNAYVNLLIWTGGSTSGVERLTIIHLSYHCFNLRLSDLLNFPPFYCCVICCVIYYLLFYNAFVWSIVCCASHSNICTVCHSNVYSLCHSNLRTVV